MYPRVCMHTCISSLVSAERLETTTPQPQGLDTATALGFKYHSPVKEPGVLGEMAGSRARAGKGQDEPGASRSANK